MRLIKLKKAQGLVEFALLLPVLLLIILGIMEFGRILIIYTSITNGVREGARYGVVVQNEADIRQIVNERIILVPPGDVNIEVRCDSGPGSTEHPFSESNCYVGGRVIVRANYAIQALTPIIQPILGAGLNVSPDGIRTIASARSIASARPAPTVTPDPSFVTNTPDAEATATAAAVATGTAAAGMTATSVALSATPTNTPDPDASATPIILAPIVISEPVLEGDTSITGTAEPNQSVTLRVIQTGLVRTVTVGGDGTFAFAGLPPLVADYTVLVQGYGEQDLEVVLALPPTLTPTNTPEVTENAITSSVSCADTSTIMLTVTGTGWPLTSSAVKEIRFNLLPEGETEVLIIEVAYAGGGGFTQPLTIDLAEGTHQLQALGVKSGVPVPGYESNLVEISYPCPLTPTPTPTATPTPITEPDLVVAGLELIDTPPYGTYERLHVTVGVSNIGDRDVSTLHWVDLFADPSGGVITQEISADYVAINALGAGTTISFTMYVPDGFETTGAHTLQVMVDTWNQVEESDETNNLSAQLPFTITIANLQPTPTNTPEITPGPRGVIQGMTYLEGVPQSNVAVYVYDDQSRLWGSARSDINGSYMVDDLPAGVYVVVAQLRLAVSQYLTQIGPVPLNSGQTQLVDIDLVCVAGCEGF